jgi:hypothetical protein
VKQIIKVITLEKIGLIKDERNRVKGRLKRRKKTGMSENPRTKTNACCRI